LHPSSLRPTTLGKLFTPARASTPKVFVAVRGREYRCRCVRRTPVSVRSADKISFAICIHRSVGGATVGRPARPRSRGREFERGCVRRPWASCSHPRVSTPTVVATVQSRQTGYGRHLHPSFHGVARAVTFAASDRSSRARDDATPGNRTTFYPSPALSLPPDTCPLEIVIADILLSHPITVSSQWRSKGVGRGGKVQLAPESRGFEFQAKNFLKAILDCEFDKKNAFGGRAPPEPAGRAKALP